MANELMNRIARDTKKAEDKRKGRYDPDGEETLTYMEWHSIGNLNTNKSVFGGFGDEGINNAESVFDRQALFDTRKKTDKNIF